MTVNHRLRSLARWTGGLACWIALAVGSGCQSGGGGGGGGGAAAGGFPPDDLCQGVVCQSGQECDPETGACQPIGGEGEGENDNNGQVDDCLPVGDDGVDGREVLEEAASRARGFDPDAIVVEASGLNAAMCDGSGYGTTEYEFVAVNPDSPQTTYFLTFDRAEWAVNQVDETMVGVSYFDVLQVEMTEAEARARLVEEGLPEDFEIWVLSVMPTPDPDLPLYFFVYDQGVATVNTETGFVADTGMD